MAASHLKTVLSNIRCLPGCKCVLRVLLCAVCAILFWAGWILRPVLWSNVHPPDLQDSRLPPKEDGGTRIPKLIHQIYINYSLEALPATWIEYRKNCLEKNPEYEYRFWDGPAVEEFIQKEFAWFWSSYQSYTYNMQRVNAARYFIVYKYGGIYMDMDVNCKRPMGELLDPISESDTQCLFTSSDPVGVSTYFIACRPLSDFFHFVLLHLEQFDKYYGLPYLTVMLGSGTLFVTSCHSLYLDKQSILVISREEFHRYFDSVFARTWHEWDGHFITWIYFDLYPALKGIVLSGATWFLILSALLVFAFVWKGWRK